MLTLQEVALALAFLLFVSVLVVLGYVLIKRALRRRLMKQLDRRIARVHAILAKHRQNDFSRIDRLLFQLNSVQDPDAVELALGEYLREGSIAPKLVAVYERLGLVDHYIAQLGTAKKWSERVEAARALGQLEVLEAIPHLVTRMRDPHEDTKTVKHAAAEALGMMRAEEAVPPLIRELAHPDDWASPRLAERLLGFGARALDPLMYSLQQEDSANVRIWAAQILGRIGDRAATRALIGRLGDREEQVRLSVCEALGRLGDRRSLSGLTERALRDPVPAVRAEAARALGRIGDPSVLDELVLLLSSSDYWSRLRAVEAIERLQPEDTFLLERGLVDESNLVRGEAARALERLGVLDRRLEDLESEDRDIVRVAIDSLVKFARAGAVDSMLKCVIHPSLAVRARICEVLGRAGDTHAAPSLFDLLEDPEWPVRTRAAQALGRMAPDGASSKLIPLLSDPAEMVRIAAIGAVQSIGIENIEAQLPSLEELFRQGSAEARLSVVDAIRTAPTDIVGGLIARALDDPNDEVRLHAAREARRRGGEAWLDQLTERLADADMRVRKVAAEALGKVSSEKAVAALAYALVTPDREFREIITDMLAPQGVDRVRELCDGGDSVERRLALAWALGKTGDAAAIPDLERLAGDRENDVRAATAGAISKIADPRSTGVLKQLLRDPSERVRSAAINGLMLSDARSALENLLAMLDEPNAFVRNRLAVALGRFGGRAVLAGLDKLEGLAEDDDGRAYIIIGRVLSGDGPAIQRALKALTDDNLRVRVDRAMAGEWLPVQSTFRKNLALDAEATLADLSTDDLRDYYLDVLRTRRNVKQRLEVLQALKTIGLGEHLDIVITVAHTDPVPDARRLAVAALETQLKSEQAVAALLRALRDPIDDVRYESLLLLATIGDPEHNEVMLQTAAMNEGPLEVAAIEALVRANERRVDDFVEELRQLEDDAVRRQGAQVLGRIGDADAQPLLIDWLDRPQPRLRRAAIEALGGIGTAEAREAIGNSLSDPDPDVRLGAAETLMEFPLGGVIRKLRKLAKDPSIEVRQSLARFLGKRETKITIDLAGLLASDPDESVRVEALGSLLKLNSPGSVERFIELFGEQPVRIRRRMRARSEDDPIVISLGALATSHKDAESRSIGIEALKALGTFPVDTFVRAMADPDPEIRLAALEATRHLDDETLADARERLSRDPVADVRKAVRKGKLRLISGDQEE